MTDPNIFSEPLPTEASYAKAIHCLVKEEQIDSGENFRLAIKRSVSSLLYFGEFMEEVTATAKMVEPFDRSTGRYIDNGAGTAKAVLHGAAFGGMLVPRVHGDAINLGDLVLPQPRSVRGAKDVGGELHQQALVVDEFGGEGLAYIGDEAGIVLEDIEERVIDDVTKQRFFRIGCGIVVHAARDAHVRYMADHKMLALQKIDTGEIAIDWDADFSDLLS